MHSASWCAPDILRMLLDKGIMNINAQNEAGVTALMLAANDNSPEAIHALLDAGADIELKDDNEGRRAADYLALRRRREEINDAALTERLTTKGGNKSEDVQGS